MHASDYFTRQTERMIHRPRRAALALDAVLGVGLRIPNKAVAMLTGFIDASLIAVSATSSSGADPEQVARDVAAALVEAL